MGNRKVGRETPRPTVRKDVLLASKLKVSHSSRQLPRLTIIVLHRMRRVKCGEEKPECERCRKSGWQCDGYGVIKSKSNSPAPIRPQDATSLSTYNASIIPQNDLDGDEQRYFQVYLDQTSTSLDLQDTTPLFWKQVVLQESISNPCVRHGLVAIGAVAKSAQMKLRWAYFTDLSDRAQEPHRQYVNFFSGWSIVYPLLNYCPADQLPLFD
jgi:Fungal Zn(2)-Cys(6) binuclear cluster domain